MKKRLHIRVGVTVALIAMLVATATSIFFYRFSYSQTSTSARKTLSQLAGTVQRTAAIAAYLDNTELADEVTNGLSRNDLVQAVYLTSVTGLKAKSGNIPEERSKTDAVVLKLDSPFIKDQTIGELTIFPNSALIVRNARRDALVGGAMLAGFTLFLAFLITWVVQRMFLYPLAQITSAINSIVPGEDDLIPTPQRHKNDEIGRLVDYLNQLLAIVQIKLDTERKLREDVQGLEKRFRMIFERAAIGIFLFELNGKMIMANESFRKFLGDEQYKKLEGQEGNCLSEIFREPEKVETMLRDAAESSMLVSDDLLINTGREEDERWAHCLFTPVRTETEDALIGVTTMQGIINDITDRVKRERIISFLAGHDPLTHLLNRRSVEEKLLAVLKKSEKNDFCVTLFLIDLDRFKPVNDTYGHEAGDRVLVEVAERLTSNLRQADIVARLGGDEFLAVTVGKAPGEGTGRVAEKLLKCLGEEIEIAGGIKVTIGASIGIADSDHHGKDLAELLSKADRAMYQVKMSGRNGYRVAESCE